MGTKQTKLNMIVLLAVVLAMGSVANATAPIVNGGENQTMYPGEAIELQGTASDPDGGTIIFWEWVIDQGPSGHDGSLSSPNSRGPLFSATVVGQYVISVYVIDSSREESALDYIVINVVEDVPPVAVLSASATEGPAPLTVTFDGSESYDEHGDTLLYDWVFGDGWSGFGESVQHTYTSPGYYTAVLSVTDNRGLDDFEIIVITVTEECLNVDPGSEGYYIYGYQPVGSSNPQTFTITNTCTSDLEISSIGLEDGSSEDYAITNSPSLPLSLAPGGTTEVEVTFTPSTTYFAEATLVIQTNDPSVAELSVWLSTSMNVPPVADAGEDESVFLDEGTILNGSATDEDNDIIVAWLWTIESAPEGSSPYISRTDTPDPRFIPDVTGDYVLSLIVADALLWSEPDYVTIHVVELLPPVAVASADVTSGQDPLTVQFDGSQSYDPQGGTLTYRWDFADNDLSYEVSPTHVFDRAGSYSVTLRVYDDFGQSGFDHIDITVTPGGNIQVSPESYDFGDVVLGTSSSTIITITNPVGGKYEDPLELLDISIAEGSSSDFAININPVGSTLQPGGSVDVEIVFTPTAVDYACAILQINSDDPVFPEIEVVLGGTGVGDEDPPEGQIATTLSFIEVSVDAGTLVGEGSGNSAGNRLNAFENMIEAAGDLIEDGLYQEACDQLGDALKKCDGQPSPPDFVAGDAAEVIKGMIEVLRTTLGCQ